MPAIWAARRRILLAQLACLGVLQAVIALIMSLSLSAVLAGATQLSVLLVVTVLAIGVARWIERVLAEDLGQDYVHQIRKLLVESALVSTKPAAIGVTVTRASNDLAALRNWVALGIVPLVSGIPLILVVLIALFGQDWRTGLAVAVPLLACAATLPILARWTLSRARELRRRRGRMAARIADSVLAAQSVLAAGGVQRELNAVDRDSTRVVQAAIQRAWATGLVRAVMITGASISTVSVVLLGHLPAAEIAGTMMLLGVLATPIGDLGRVVEYRQNYRAAVRIVLPLIAQAREFAEQEAGKQSLALPKQPVAVHIYGLKPNGDRIKAEPGDRIMLAGDSEVVQQKMAELITMQQLEIAGIKLADLSLPNRRQLLGVASAQHYVERGSVRRLAGYRVPEAKTDEITEVLRQVGLTQLVSSDPKGLKRQLKNGGKPWATADIARLKLARALLRQPPVLITEGIDVELIPIDYPGVVISSNSGSCPPDSGWQCIRV